jgi:NAD(P)-dependent dehydrogenase (short-subunit alcohol dehydrogenase family)
MVGRVALITGGGSGIGRATALLFAAKGAKVVIAGRRLQEGEETAQLIYQAGGEGLFVQTDVTQAEQVETLVQTTLAKFGRLDFAFNNAGYEGKRGLMIDLEESVWDEVISINLKGIWLSMRYELKQMIAQGSGVIVNNASGAGRVGIAKMAAYVASKHGVVGLTKSAALEYAKQGIRINSISPGSVETAMGVRNFGGVAEFRQVAARQTPLGRAGRAEEIAQLVVWLCSEEASFVVGADFAVDGGATA